MLIKKSQSNKKQNSKSCIIWEYNFKSKNLGLATAKINGRYPEQGKVVNKKCDLIYYIISGTGVINYNNHNYILKPDSSIYLKQGRPYFLKGKNLFIIIASQPSWYLKQYKQIK